MPVLVIFEQHYLDCLSQASYLIADETTGRGVVVDPRRDVAGYLASAEEAGVRIEMVIETHFHADFLSGHLELAEATGAEIAYGPGAETEFPSRTLADGERLSLGDVTLEILHTPGHTPESISVVVYSHAEDETPYGVLTGDALFVGDVGRPDLLASRGVEPDALARQLYDSLHGKLLSLPDPTRVFPAHGAGSACGKNLSTETWSTIGDQRSTNYALAPMSADEFVSSVTEGQTSPPAYFGYDAKRNRELRKVLDDSEPPPALDLDEVEALREQGAIVLDTRDAVDFAKAHLAGSINVGIAGRYAEYAGGVIEAGRPIVLVTDPGLELESRVRLARIGFDDVVGHLAEPVRTFGDRPESVARSSRLTAAELRERMADLDALTVIDVRSPGEVAEGRIPGAVEIPLPELAARAGRLDRAVPTVVYCAGGYRSSIAASLLASRGFADVSDLVGGYGAWAQRSAPA